VRLSFKAEEIAFTKKLGSVGGGTL